MWFVSSEDFDLNIYTPVPGSNIIHVYCLMKFGRLVPLQKLAFLRQIQSTHNEMKQPET